MSNSFRNPTAGISAGDNNIKCDVKNCSYHTVNDCCSASCIHVQSCTGTNRCCNSGETACATFMEKK